MHLDDLTTEVILARLEPEVANIYIFPESLSLGLANQLGFLELLVESRIEIGVLGRA